jgi:RNA polymerase sigma-70 factor (ECF subfamily)
MGRSTAAGGVEEVTVVAAARAGDSAAFAELAERYRRELHIHCYRMLGSFEDAEDQVQETFLRAWRKRQTFEGRSKFRTWLYRIATNACLDFIARRRVRTPPRFTPPTSADPGMESQRRAEITWLQPYPDHLLDELPSKGSQPEDAIVAREGIELAFLTAIQLLPPRRRAVLILRDVLDWSAKETASMLETSVASVNSSLQRARALLKEQLPRDREPPPPADPSEEERAVLRRLMEATERGDAEAFVELLRADARFAMPPQPEWHVGHRAIVRGWVEGGFGSASFGELRCLATRANRQPAVAAYLRRPDSAEFRSLTIDVLRIENGRIVEVTTFYGEGLFERFGLPLVLESEGGRA